MKNSLLLPALAGLLISIAPAVASAADTFCPTRSSVYGTVASVKGDTMTIQTHKEEGFVPVRFRGADINYRGLALRPGVYVGVFGCMVQRDRYFAGEQLTLATSAETYPGRHDTDAGMTTIEGRIDAVRGGRVLIDSNQGHGNVWVQTNRDDLRAGQLVRAHGRFTDDNRSFVADTITIVSGDRNDNGGMVTIQGRIDAVRSGRVLIDSN
ncbi:MAG: hypothetical protein M3N13_00440, partial [Candidatus Eremiobacteraeota bacterium]|nr:hypothetical protein [Candidatus Eremiobacteraeota bacterium]